MPEHNVTFETSFGLALVVALSAPEGLIFVQSFVVLYQMRFQLGECLGLEVAFVTLEFRNIYVAVLHPSVLVQAVQVFGFEIAVAAP